MPKAGSLCTVDSIAGQSAPHREAVPRLGPGPSGAAARGRRRSARTRSGSQTSLISDVVCAARDQLPDVSTLRETSKGPFVEGRLSDRRPTTGYRRMCRWCSGPIMWCRCRTS